MLLNGIEEKTLDNDTHLISLHQYCDPGPLVLLALARCLSQSSANGHFR